MRRRTDLGLAVLALAVLAGAEANGQQNLEAARLAALVEHCVRREIGERRAAPPLEVGRLLGRLEERGVDVDLALELARERLPRGPSSRVGQARILSGLHRYREGGRLGAPAASAEILALQAVSDLEAVELPDGSGPALEEAVGAGKLLERVGLLEERRLLAHRIAGEMMKFPLAEPELHRQVGCLLEAVPGPPGAVELFLAIAPEGRTLLRGAQPVLLATIIEAHRRGKLDNRDAVIEEIRSNPLATPIVEFSLGAVLEALGATDPWLRFVRAYDLVGRDDIDWLDRVPRISRATIEEAGRSHARQVWRAYNSQAGLRQYAALAPGPVPVGTAFGTRGALVRVAANPLAAHHLAAAGLAAPPKTVEASLLLAGLLADQPAAGLAAMLHEVWPPPGPAGQAGLAIMTGWRGRWRDLDVGTAGLTESPEAALYRSMLAEASGGPAPRALRALTALAWLGVPAGDRGRFDDLLASRIWPADPGLTAACRYLSVQTAGPFGRPPTLRALIADFPCLLEEVESSPAPLARFVAREIRLTIGTLPLDTPPDPCRWSAVDRLLSGRPKPAWPPVDLQGLAESAEAAARDAMRARSGQRLAATIRIPRHVEARLRDVARLTQLLAGEPLARQSMAAMRAAERAAEIYRWASTPPPEAGEVSAVSPEHFEASLTRLEATEKTLVDLELAMVQLYAGEDEAAALERKRRFQLHLSRLRLGGEQVALDGLEFALEAHRQLLESLRLESRVAEAQGEVLQAGLRRAEAHLARARDEVTTAEALTRARAARIEALREGEAAGRFEVSAREAEVEVANIDLAREAQTYAVALEMVEILQLLLEEPMVVDQEAEPVAGLLGVWATRVAGQLEGTNLPAVEEALTAAERRRKEAEAQAWLTSVLRILGGVIGWLTGGPVGAAAGDAIAHFGASVLAGNPAWPQLLPAAKGIAQLAIEADPELAEDIKKVLGQVEGFEGQIEGAVQEIPWLDENLKEDNLKDLLKDSTGFFESDILGPLVNAFDPDGGQGVDEALEEIVSAGLLKLSRSERESLAGRLDLDDLKRQPLERDLAEALRLRGALLVRRRALAALCVALEKRDADRLPADLRTQIDGAGWSHLLVATDGSEGPLATYVGRLTPGDPVAYHKLLLCFRSILDRGRLSSLVGPIVSPFTQAFRQKVNNVKKALARVDTPPKGASALEVAEHQVDSLRSAKTQMRTLLWWVRDSNSPERRQLRSALAQAVEEIAAAMKRVERQRAMLRASRANLAAGQRKQAGARHLVEEAQEVCSATSTYLRATEKELQAAKAAVDEAQGLLAVQRLESERLGVEVEVAKANLEEARLRLRARAQRLEVLRFERAALDRELGRDGPGRAQAWAQLEGRRLQLRIERARHLARLRPVFLQLREERGKDDPEIGLSGDPGAEFYGRAIRDWMETTGTQTKMERR